MRGLRHLLVVRLSVLDVKLGLRMLGKYPALSLTGGLGMAIAIAAVAFTLISTLINPVLCRWTTGAASSRFRAPTR
ncbi:MAG TPA: hypothetical protein VFW98_01885 [Gemmatimonadaceae bacterium]|nr:hypothetical protein [Gemmatimonadaceae bacterium]